jgi:hypothetical protein
MGVAAHSVPGAVSSVPLQPLLRSASQIELFLRVCICDPRLLAATLWVALLVVITIGLGAWNYAISILDSTFWDSRE